LRRGTLAHKAPAGRGTGGKTLPGGHTNMKLAILEYENEKQRIKLRLWPADTLEKARSFYRRP
jgi:hypothetical protein